MQARFITRCNHKLSDLVSYKSHASLGLIRRWIKLPLQTKRPQQDEHVNNQNTSELNYCTLNLLLVKMKLNSWKGLTVTSYKDHFEQSPLRTRETISYKSIGVTSNKDFLYEVVPKILHSISYKNHFVQRPFRKKEIVQKPKSQFCIWVFWSSTVFFFWNSNIRTADTQILCRS